MIRRTNFILGMYVRGTYLNFSSIGDKGVTGVKSVAMDQKLKTKE